MLYTIYIIQYPDHHAKRIFANMKGKKIKKKILCGKNVNKLNPKKKLEEKI